MRWISHVKGLVIQKKLTRNHTLEFDLQYKTNKPRIPPGTLDDKRGAYLTLNKAMNTRSRLSIRTPIRTSGGR